MSVSHKWEVPKNGWFISGKIQMKMDDDWGYPHDETETPKVIDISWESWTSVPMGSLLQGVSHSEPLWTGYRGRNMSIQLRESPTLWVNNDCLVGGWATPLNKYYSVGMSIPNICNNKKWQPNHQPVICWWLQSWFERAERQGHLSQHSL